MADLELERTSDERRLYALDGLGSLRLEGIASRSATAEVEGESWRFAHRHFWLRDIEVIDAGGTRVGWFKPRGRLRRGGALHWAGRELELRPASRWRERYALADVESELAIFDGKGWGQRPVTITTDDTTAVDPGLLLFAAFIVGGLAEDANGAAPGLMVS